MTSYVTFEFRRKSSPRVNTGSVKLKIKIFCSNLLDGPDTAEKTCCLQPTTTKWWKEKGIEHLEQSETWTAPAWPHAPETRSVQTDLCRELSSMRAAETQHNIFRLRFEHAWTTLLSGSVLPFRWPPNRKLNQPISLFDTFCLTCCRDCGGLDIEYSVSQSNSQHLRTSLESACFKMPSDIFRGGWAGC